MKTVFYFLATVILVACSHSESGKTRKENEFKKYFLAKLKDYDSTATVDSFRLVRYVPLTVYSKVMGQYDQAVSQTETNNRIMELQGKQLNLIGQQLVLYRNLDNDLYEQKKIEAKNALDTSRLLKEKADQLSNRLRYFDSLLKKADTVKPIGYQAMCFYQIRKADQSVHKDTFRVILNVDKDIISPDDFYKEK